MSKKDRIKALEQRVAELEQRIIQLEGQLNYRSYPLPADPPMWVPPYPRSPWGTSTGDRMPEPLWIPWCDTKTITIPADSKVRVWI